MDHPAASGATVFCPLAPTGPAGVHVEAVAGAVFIQIIDAAGHVADARMFCGARTVAWRSDGAPDLAACLVLPWRRGGMRFEHDAFTVLVAANGAGAGVEVLRHGAVAWRADHPAAARVSG